ncbi:MAG: PilN domain-containing protein [Acidobacteria bacterium]|nr:PilN domain-containing protein [Acidobacteriota bacterium]
MIRINLLREKTPASAARWTIERSQVGIFAAILLVVTFGAMGWWYWYLMNTRIESASLRQELSQEKIRLQAIKAQLEKYEAQKKTLEHRITVIERLKANQKGPLLLMSGLIDSIPDSPTLWLKSLVQQDQTVVIEGKALDIPSIADFIANLNGRPPFRHVELGDLKADGDAFNFSLNCEIAR